MKVIKLHPADNVLVAISDIAGNETLECEGVILATRRDIAFGHKIALEKIQKGGYVIKYGVPIGFAKIDIQPGDWVHYHNLGSNYIEGVHVGSEE